VVAYRDLMGVMNLLRGAGYLKVALVGLEDTGQGSAIGGQLPGTSPVTQQAAPATRP
jgi:biopolymer transport protein ExbD